MDKNEFAELKKRLADFARIREWDKFHSPKNLTMALIVEAAELTEHFQWLTETESTQLSPEKLKEIGLEMADIQIYLIRLADKLGIDLLEKVYEKIELNEKKYPPELVRGSAKKYSEY